MDVPLEFGCNCCTRTGILFYPGTGPNNYRRLETEQCDWNTTGRKLKFEVFTTTTVGREGGKKCILGLSRAIREIYRRLLLYGRGGGAPLLLLLRENYSYLIYPMGFESLLFHFFFFFVVGGAGFIEAGMIWNYIFRNLQW